MESEKRLLEEAIAGTSRLLDRPIEVKRVARGERWRIVKESCTRRRAEGSLWLRLLSREAKGEGSSERLERLKGYGRRSSQKSKSAVSVMVSSASISFSQARQSHQDLCPSCK